MSLAVDELVQDGLMWHSLNTFRRNGVRKTLGFLAFPGFQRFATIFDPRLCHLLALFVKRHLAPSQQHAFQFCFRFQCKTFYLTSRSSYLEFYEPIRIPITWLAVCAQERIY